MEDNIENETVPIDSDEDIDFTARKKHGKQTLRIDESDSDDENDLSLVNPVEANGSFGGHVSDEDSNESKESSDDGDKISLSTDRKKKWRKKKSDEQDITDEHKSKVNALCDAESSSDESDEPAISETVNATRREKAPQRMSAKQAEEQMKVIQSESQRLAREVYLSVPYHKPKQHSLKEFLNRRTINRPVPMALTKKAAATIKMTREELEQYAKSLADRNKESQEFYRSDSDDDNDAEQTTPKCDEQEDTHAVVEVPDAISESTNLVANSTDVIDITEITSEVVTDVEPAESMKGTEVQVAEKDVTDTVIELDVEVSNENATITEGKPNEPDLPKPTKTIEIDYNFGEKEDNENKTLKDLLPLYGTITPCLKTPVNGVINLDAEDEKPVKSGSDELLERFIKNVAKRPNRSAKEVSILSTDNGVIELNNVKIESDDQNCIHSKPRKDCFTLKEELSLRIAAMRKEDLKKKQASTIEIPMEGSDSESDISTSSGKEIEGTSTFNGGSKENYDSAALTERENDGILDNEAEEINDEDGEEAKEENVSDEENSEENDENSEADEEEEDNESASNPHESELVPKTKQRKRIIVVDNSDDDEQSSEGKLESLSKTEDLNLTSNSLEDSLYEYVPEKTMSQICKNQSLADQMIDSCSKIIPEVSDLPEESEPDNMSTLFTQATDNITETQLLDLCSGSFVTQATNANFVEPEMKLNSGTQPNIFSDNEFSDDDIGSSKKSKQRRKVNISDEEDQDDEVANVVQNEESSASINHQNESDDNLSDEEVEEKIVEYDSEENEIEVPIAPKRKIAEFFENEAELSESEWGSADEDERNLDKFEIELGDEDEFDQNQLVSELDRIHRRRMLDQDAREVKIIKDTHFEDEEESGLGRQRQYKWKHMQNSLNVDENRTADVDGSENVKSDDENEEMWRRMRHERYNILQETKNQNESINDSKLIVTTKTKKRISIVKTTANLNTSATKDLSFLISRMKQEQTHRSSLLIRDEQTLANLAKMTTDEDNIPSVNSNSRNFLFNVVSSENGKSLGKRKLDDDGAAGEGKSRKVTKRIKKSTLSVLDKLM